MQKLLNEIDKLQKEIKALRPLSGTIIKQLREYYRIGLTYSSNALEGNSLTESETKIVIEDGLTASGKPLRDHFEAIGHSEAYDFMYSLIKKEGFSQSNIKTLHKLFYQRIDPHGAGTYRTEKVLISGSKYSCPNPSEIPSLIKNFIQKLKTLHKNHHPVDFAALVHKEFVFIHPFIDGNGRVARLLMNVILLQCDYSLAVIHPILRAEYIQTLEKAHHNDSDFRQFIALRIKESQKDYLRLVG